MLRPIRAIASTKAATAPAARPAICAGFIVAGAAEAGAVDVAIAVDEVLEKCEVERNEVDGIESMSTESDVRDAVREVFDKILDNDWFLEIAVGDVEGVGTAVLCRVIVLASVMVSAV